MKIENIKDKTTLFFENKAEAFREREAFPRKASASFLKNNVVLSLIK